MFANTDNHRPLRVSVTASALALLAVSAVSLLPATSQAASTGVALESPRIDTSSRKSLQRGARAFVNYCMGCHSAGYARYNRVAKDIGLTDEAVAENLIFTTDEEGEPTKVGSLMLISMPDDYAEQAFGVVPPNLALTARSRGADWVYTYLKSYYVDPERPTGVNNLVYKGTAMPNPLWSLQGTMLPVYGEEHDGVKPIIGLQAVGDGELTPEEFDRVAADITNFMVYLADPVRNTRHKIGTWVLLFLAGLFVLTYFLKKEYWKDVVKN